MLDPQTAALATRRQQRIDDLCVACIRALSGQTDLMFRGRRLYRGRVAMPPFGPHLSPEPLTDDFGSFRGAADAMGLRLRYSDPAIFKQVCPARKLERLLFEMLEQFRVEALVPADMPGVANNLRHRFEAWSLAVFNAGLTETSRGILLYTVAQVTRARVTAQGVVEATEDAIEATRMALAKRIGPGLARLRKLRFDQLAYSEHALSISRIVAGMLESEDPTSDQAIDQQSEDEPPTSPAFWLDYAIEEGDGEFATASIGSSRSFDDPAQAYRIFTRQFDSEMRPERLVRKAELNELRQKLDVAIEKQNLSSSRIARALMKVLATPERDGWEREQEEGHIDGRRLGQLISSPQERRLFTLERHIPAVQCAVSFLIDCSGSMRQHIEAVAILVDVLTRAFDQIGVISEVLGFTTGAWNGGRAQRAWARAGRPAIPGRLNETMHLIFKDSQSSWRRARPALAALLKSDLFREGVDGEAVQWAASRLVEGHNGRRLLLVISDGSPTDSATALANDPHYLDHHLVEVLAAIEERGEVEVYGLGVGLDLSPYYRHNHAFDLTHSVTNKVLGEVVALLGKAGTKSAVK